MRRFAGGNRLDKTAFVYSPIDGHPTRPHRVSRALIESNQYLQVTAQGSKPQKNHSSSDVENPVGTSVS